MHKNLRVIVAIPFFITYLLSMVQCTKLSISSNQPLAVAPTSALIYYSDRVNSSPDFGSLYLVNLTTNEEKYLTPNSSVSRVDGFSWSPITQRVIYTGKGDKGSSVSNLELYSVDLNGNKLRLTDNDTFDSSGRWSPDGQRIAFWSDRPDGSFLYLMNPDGSNVQPVFENDHDFVISHDFIWSPDSKKLAISTIYPYIFPVNLDAPSNNILIVEIEPRSVSLPLSTTRDRTNLSWSYDSKKLLYLSDIVEIAPLVSAATTLYIFDTQTLQDTLIAEFKIIGTSLWSPVENVIAFSAARPNEHNELNIYLINGDGTGLRQLTEDGAYRVASWSPDGSKLAVEVSGERMTEHEIYIFDVESQSLQRITSNNVYDALPMWVN